MQIKIIVWEVTQFYASLSPKQSQEMAKAILDNEKFSPIFEVNFSDSSEDADHIMVSYWREETEEEVARRQEDQKLKEHAQRILEISQLAILANKYPEAGYRKMNERDS